MRIDTVGHSTRSAAELFALLRAHDVKILADVRAIPRSRRHPQFEKSALEKMTEFRYVHLPKLGGLRKPKKDSINTAWRNAGFRGYADYMQTPEFDEAVKSLIDLASEDTVAIMCAEAVPWRCHRSLLSDALVAHGVDVFHIMTEKKAEPHHVTKFALVEGERITYPEETGQLDLSLGE